MKRILVILATFCLISPFLTGCSGSSTSSTTEMPDITSVPANEIGNLEVYLKDAPLSANIDHIWVTIANLETHEQGGPWITIDAHPPMFDLKLIEGIEQVLTSQSLFKGTYTQIRFDVTSVVIQNGSLKYDAILPSDKIRLVETFKIFTGETTRIVIDFNASKSVIFNGAGEYAYKPVIHLLVPEPGVLGITTPSLDNGEIGLEYLAGLPPQLQATGGKKPYIWNISAGALPPGLSLNSENGKISGMPSQAGDYTFTIQVTDASVPAQTDSESFTVRIAPKDAVLIITTSLPNGEQGEPYVAVIDAIFGIAPYTFNISAGTLPDGLTLEAVSSQGTCDIFGTPTKRGDYSFTIKVTDSSSPSQTDLQVLSLHIQ
jgi:hypothetical protein